MDAFLRRHGMHLFDVERVASKGGSLRGYAQKLGGPRPVSPRVGEFLGREEAAGLYDPATYRAYIARVNQLRDRTVAYLRECKARGATVAGYGASATVTTLMHHFQIGELIDFLVDDNPLRHGTVSPGYRVPVLPPQALYEKKPDVVIVLAWRFGRAILERHTAHLHQGGTWVVPLPVWQEQRGRTAA
jgi:hypothetical protein